MFIKIVKSIAWITFIYLSSIICADSPQMRAWNDLAAVLPSPISIILDVLAAIVFLFVLISFWLPDNKQTTLINKEKNK